MAFSQAPGWKGCAMTNKRAFTLVELLTVIAIIMLLVAILVPALTRAIELARRAICSTRLSAIGKAMALYAGANDSCFPVAPAVIWTGQGASNSWTGKTNGKYRTTEPVPTDSDVPVTASQWLLVRGGNLSPTAFICPSTDDTADEPGTASYEYYDFSSRDHISYSFQMPYGRYVPTNMDPPMRGLAADKSPFYDTPTGALVGGITPAKNDESNNSNNHMKEVQNVLFVDGHVDRDKTANMGVEGDHIYTRYRLGAGGAAGTPTIGEVGNNLLIEELYDTFFGP